MTTKKTSTSKPEVLQAFEGESETWIFFREGFLRRGGKELPDESVCRQLYNDFCEEVKSRPL
jgi:uncharacterized protein (DUF2237 family)